MNILFTGAMGFIASNTIPKLLNKGYNVLGFDNLSKPSLTPTDRMKKESGENWKNFTFHKVDINNYEHMVSALASYNKQIDIIIHLAAVGSVPLSFTNPQYSLETNIIGFVNMIQLANNLNVNKFIYASSSSVYGSSLENPRVENKIGSALSPYSLAKQNNESLSQMLLNKNIKKVGLRFFNVYGPGQGLNGYYTPVIPRFILEEEPEVYGNGEITRDFTFVDDVSDAILLSINNGDGVYNVGTGNSISLNVILTLLGKINKAKYKDPRLGDVLNSQACTLLAEKELSFKAKIGINEGILKTKSFYQQHFKNVTIK